MTLEVESGLLNYCRREWMLVSFRSVVRGEGRGLLWDVAIDEFLFHFDEYGRAVSVEPRFLESFCRTTRNESST